jgi:transcriptional regulator with XRE-family HTH domain
MQRQMANLSLRQLSALTEISNPYLSQVERGLHEPSIRVLKSIADALNVSAEILFEQAGLITPRQERRGDRGGHSGRQAPERRAAPRAARRLSQLRRVQPHHFLTPLPRDGSSRRGRPVETIATEEKSPSLTKEPLECRYA